MPNHPKEELTLVLVKPDGVMRGLTGEVISRFEKRGLKIIGLKMVLATREHVAKHYPESDEWFASVGTRMLTFFKENGIHAKEHFGTEDPIQIGKKVKEGLGNYLTQSPVVAMVVQGMHAITSVRKLVGSTYPVDAPPGTIRGDFSVDTPAAANVEGRSVQNIVHASGNKEEAEHEINHWFKKEELFIYKRADEDVMF